MFHVSSYGIRCYVIFMEVYLKYECEKDTTTDRPWGNERGRVRITRNMMKTSWLVKAEVVTST